MMLHKTAILMFAITVINGSVNASGYLRDSSGTIVHNNYGECVHTSYWRPAAAEVGCDGMTASVTKPEAAEFAMVESEPEAHVVEETSFETETLFAFDTADLGPEAQARLDGLLASMADRYDLLKMEVAGHADRIGPAQYNQNLALRRADAVGQYLIRQGGLDPRRLTVVSRGESEPVVRCPDARGQALIECLAPNRRVEVAIETASIE
jgi:OOP family OmpA-OmpF porin